ncbi:MAG TPA: glycosyltransferase [Pyrinomonadaceae bacterium]|nr:glycosyltransferase [Pyrinomonadaceae bacterium]
MKILRIIARLNVGGPARHVVWLTSALQDDEFQSKLIAGKVPQGEEDMAYIADAAGVSPIFIEEMSRELSLKDFVSLFKIYSQIRRQRPDIIHTHTAKAGTVGRIAALLYRWTTFRKLKVVHTFHGHVFHSYYGKGKTRLFLLIEKFLARFVTDKIITISPQQFHEIHEEFGIGRREQFEIVPLGIDLEPFADSDGKREKFRNEIGVASDEVLVGFVGRLTEIKNIPMLLQGVAKYAETSYADNPKLTFIIVGDGHMRQTLEKEAASLKVNNLVTFLGNRIDTNVVYAALDIIALTSLNEGTPLSLIEAMASERPVISTLVGGVRDLLGEIGESSDGFNIHERGLSVESGEAGALAKGLIYLAENEKLRLRLARAGKIYVELNYSKDRLISDIKSLYRNLLK